MNPILGYRCKCCWAWRPADMPLNKPVDAIDEGQFQQMYCCSVCNSLNADKEAAENCCPNGEPLF